MAYAQDTILNVNAANSLAGELDTLLLAAGWSVVESITPSGTNRVKVYKSNGTANAAGYDWFITIIWDSIGTEDRLEVIPGAAYDTGTKRMSQIPYLITGNTSNGYAEPVTGDQLGPVAINYAATTSDKFNTVGRVQNVVKPWFATIVPSSAFGYWASITLDHFALYTTIATVNGVSSAMYSTLDVDTNWSALNSASFGNGVAVNPIVLTTGIGTGSGPSSYQGISTSMLGSTSGGRIANVHRQANNIGTPLPALTGNWLPASAWRPSYYLVNSLAGAGVTVPTWDEPRYGDGFHIGSGIDYYQVYGGSLGDTVTIAGATYVLSGPMKVINGDPISYAVLVE